MSLFDDMQHQVTVLGPPLVTQDSARGEVITWPTVRAAGVPCMIRVGAGGERNEFDQSQRPRSTHSIAFNGDNDGGVQPGDKLVDDNTGQTYRFTGDMPQQGYGGIEHFNVITVTEMTPSV
jgi:hypothetical protein